MLTLRPSEKGGSVRTDDTFSRQKFAVLAQCLYIFFYFSQLEERVATIITKFELLKVKFKRIRN